MIYKCNQVGDIQIFKVESFSISYKNGFRFKPYYAKSPTRKDLEDLMQYFESAKTSDFVVRINILDQHEKYNSHWSTLYHEVNEVKYLAFNEADLINLSVLNKEKYAPREGYAPCCYCGKQILSEKLITKTIIGRGTKKVWNSWKGQYENKASVTQESLKFCSGQCAAHEQMSREG